MQEASAILDFREDTVHILGQKVNLIVTDSGHYALPLRRDQRLVTQTRTNEKAQMAPHKEELPQEITDKYADDDVCVPPASQNISRDIVPPLTENQEKDDRLLEIQKVGSSKTQKVDDELLHCILLL